MGKRVYFFEQYDFVISILMLLFLAATMLFNVGVPFLEVLYTVALTFGYVLTGSLTTNRRLADCVINSVVISSVPVCVLAIYSFASGWAREGLVGFGGVGVLFSSPSSLAVFLTVSTVFSAYFVKVSSKRAAKVMYSLICILELVSLCLTMFLPAVLALIIGVIAYPVTKMRRISGVLLAFLAALPYCVLLIPVAWAQAASNVPLLSALGLSELVRGWRSGLSLFADNILGGTGIGEGGFNSEFSSHGGVGSDCGSFFLQVGCEAGIVALLLLILLFVIRLIHRGHYRKFVKGSQVSELSRFTSVCTVSMIALGAFCNIWADMSVYYLFWCVFAIGGSTLRISRREYDERVDYYSDGRSADSSSVDVALG